MSSPVTQLSPEEILDNFSLMVVEEYLVKRRLTETLSCLRRESATLTASSGGRPAEEAMLFSWYDVALRLRLPELMSEAENAQRSVLDNLISVLVREAAKKNRRSQETTLSGLAALPRRTALPPVNANSSGNNSRAAQEDADEDALLTPQATDRASLSLSLLKNSPSQRQKSSLELQRQKSHVSAVTKRSHAVEASLVTRNTNNKGTHTSEHWIPDQTRMRQFHRELQIAKETFNDTKVLEDTLAKEMKRLQVSDVDRARLEVELKWDSKVPCGCCLMPFLKVNLPMRVSQKAILDIRVKWSGKLSSSTVFRGSSLHEMTSKIAVDKWGNKIQGDANNDEQMTFSGAMPRCYDQVGVCRFCAQFFDDPDEFRPSYQTITFHERKAAHFEQKRREREYWDPLKMLEKDRTKEQEYLKLLESESTSPPS